MAKNVFTEDLKAFLKTGNYLDHLVSFVPWPHKMADPTRKKGNKDLEKQGGLGVHVRIATAMSIFNILHDGDYTMRVVVGKRNTKGRDVRPMAREVTGRVNASILIVAHEAWERYIKRAYARLLFSLKDELSPPRRKKFHRVTPQWRSYLNTLAYFEDYARWSLGNDCSEALEFLCDHLAWDQIRYKQWQGMEWLEVVAVVAFCRHCIVHDEGRVCESRWRRLNRAQTAFVRAMMARSVLTEEERILPPKEMINRLIEAMMSLGYGLYVLLSQRCRFEVEYASFH